MSKKDDEEWAEIRRQQQERRDKLREQAAWTDAAREQIELGKDDEQFRKDFGKIMGQADALSDAELKKRIEKSGRKAGKSRGQINEALKRAKHSKKKQGSGCVVILIPLVFAAGGIVTGLTYLI